MVEIPKEIVLNLKLRNRLHFDQARGMPFTIPLLSIEFDWAANSVTSNLVLEGEYSNSELDFLQQTLLKHCKKEHDRALLEEEVHTYRWKEKI
eukprot:15364622-Ditylum_brightwellii.AAC.1